MIIPHDETPACLPEKIHGDLVTSPVQTVLDLRNSSGRGRGSRRCGDAEGIFVYRGMMRIQREKNLETGD